MMEKFLDDAESWEHHHMETWFGRQAGFVGGAASAQFELMSPMGVVGFTRDPSLFNLMKAAYGPSIAFGGYSAVSWITGIRISLGERIMHSADMARRTGRFAAHTAGRAALFSFRAVRAVSPYALLAGFSYAAYRMTLDSFEKYGTSILPVGGWN